MALVSVKMPYLLQCLKDANFSKENKPSIFLTLGDIALGNPTLIITNLRDILQLYEMAYDAIATLSDSNIIDNVEYAEILKEHIVDSMVCIIHGAIYSEEAAGGLDQIMTLMRDHFPKMQIFISTATRREHNPTIEFVRDCLALITDMYTNQIKRMGVPLDRALVNNLIEMLASHSQKAQVEQVINYARANLIC